MHDRSRHHVYLSYNYHTKPFVAGLALRLRGDARLSFWFEPWHAVPGRSIQEQMEEALDAATSCAVFIGSDGVEGWQNTQMRAAIQRHVEDDPAYRVIPIILPGVDRPRQHDLPRFLRLYHPVQFTSSTDEQAFRSLVAGIVGIPPIEVEGFLEGQASVAKDDPPPAIGGFSQGRALLIGVAHYPNVRPQVPILLDNIAAVADLLTDPARCGYPPAQVKPLLDQDATRDGIIDALAAFAKTTNPTDTAVVYFAGHGKRNPAGGDNQQYILPYDADLDDLATSAIRGDEMSAMLRDVKAERLLVVFDSCHSGGAAALQALAALEPGLSEEYYAGLAQGRGRVVMASSRPEEYSLVLKGAEYSLFTTHLLAALKGEAPTLGDGYVRAFDVFRHVSTHVPPAAEAVGEEQHPVFKSAVESDFPIARIRR